MYPDPFRPGQADDMDPAARREFFGRSGRRHETTEAPPIVPMHGDGFSAPLVPDATSDSPLSSDHRISRRRPISDGLASHGDRFADD